MRGSVIANTTNGDVVIELFEVHADTPMSFSSWNGDVQVTLPASVERSPHAVRARETSTPTSMSSCSLPSPR